MYHSTLSGGKLYGIDVDNKKSLMLIAKLSKTKNIEAC